MEWIKQLRIGQRLGIAFGLVLTLMLIIAGVGLYGMAAVGAGLHTVYEDRTVALGQLAEINRIALRNRILVMDVIANPAPPNIEKRNKEMRENAAKAEELLAAFLKTKLTPKEAELIKEYMSVRKDYIEKGLNPVMTAALAGDLTAASSAYTDGVSPLAPPVEKLAGELVKLQVDEAAREYEIALTTEATSRWVTIAAASTALLLGIFMAWWISGSIAKPVRAAVQMAEAVAGGELYEVEREIADLDSAGRLEARRRRSRQVADALHQWLRQQRQKVPDGSATARAIDYSLKRWAALTRYLDDGELPIGRVEMWRGDRRCWRRLKFDPPVRALPTQI